MKTEGDAVGKLVEKGKSQFAGPEIMGKTLGVIGLGAIGSMVANVALHLGMNVVGCDPFLSVNSALRLSPKVKCVKTPDEFTARQIIFHYTFLTMLIQRALLMLKLLAK